jgi:hypothetical protein
MHNTTRSSESQITPCDPRAFYNVVALPPHPRDFRSHDSGSSTSRVAIVSRHNRQSPNPLLRFRRDGRLEVTTGIELESTRVFAACGPRIDCLKLHAHQKNHRHNASGARETNPAPGLDKKQASTHPSA